MYRTVEFTRVPTLENFADKEKLVFIVPDHVVSVERYSDDDADEDRQHFITLITLAGGRTETVRGVPSEINKLLKQGV